LEGDEYLSSPIDSNPKFLHYHPNIALISGISWDHINVFKTEEDYVEAFRNFIKNITSGGILVYNEEDENLAKLVDEAENYFRKMPYKTPNYETIALETADEQIEVLFNSLTLEKQAEILVKSVKEKEKGIEQMQKLDEAYLAGDLKKMEELYSEDEDMTEEYKKALVDTRNLKWVSKLNKLFETKSGVVAVGCLHLVGETGLIKQLEKNGFSVEPVKL
jgi:UDP-N-acetylmuramate-alanine ligase